jgi:hypothetical protein
LLAGFVDVRRELERIRKIGRDYRQLIERSNQARLVDKLGGLNKQNYWDRGEARLWISDGTTWIPVRADGTVELEDGKSYMNSIANTLRYASITDLKWHDVVVVVPLPAERRFVCERASSKQLETLAAQWVQQAIEQRSARLGDRKIDVGQCSAQDATKALSKVMAHLCSQGPSIPAPPDLRPAKGKA